MRVRPAPIGRSRLERFPAPPQGQNPLPSYGRSLLRPGLCLLRPGLSRRRPIPLKGPSRSSAPLAGAGTSRARNSRRSKTSGAWCCPTPFASRSSSMRKCRSTRSGPRRPLRGVFGGSRLDARGAAISWTTPLRFDGDAEPVRHIRIGRQPNNTTRVVLEVAGISSYSVYPLYDPYRLIIDCVRSAPLAASVPGTTARCSPIKPAVASGMAALSGLGTGSSVCRAACADDAPRRVSEQRAFTKCAFASDPQRARRTKSRRRVFNCAPTWPARLAHRHRSGHGGAILARPERA